MFNTFLSAEDSQVGLQKSTFSAILSETKTLNCYYCVFPVVFIMGYRFIVNVNTDWSVTILRKVIINNLGMSISQVSLTRSKS